MRVKITLACTECKQRNYNTIVVCVVVLISALVVLLLDFVFGLGMDLLLTAGA